MSALASSRLRRGFLLVLQTDFDEEEGLGDIYPVWASLRVNEDLLAFAKAMSRVCVDNELILAEEACDGASHGFTTGERPADSAPYEWRLRCSSTGFSLFGINLESGIRVDTAPMLFEDLTKALARDDDASQAKEGKTGWLGSSLLVAYTSTGGLIDLAELLMRTHPPTSTSYTERQMTRCIEERAEGAERLGDGWSGEVRPGDEPVPARRRPRI